MRYQITDEQFQEQKNLIEKQFRQELSGPFDITSLSFYRRRQTGMWQAHLVLNQTDDYYLSKSHLTDERFSIRSHPNTNTQLMNQQKNIPSIKQDPTFTAKNLQILCDFSYDLDKNACRKKQIAPIQIGEQIIADGQHVYEVLAIIDNPLNGLQAMAVRLGNHFFSKKTPLIFVFAGTDGDDESDVFTDIVTIMGGKKSILVPKTEGSLKEIDGQSITALQFYQQVYKKFHPSHCLTTGHSLGEYLALYIACEKQWPNIGFNGPDPSNILSERSLEWGLHSTSSLKNYRNKYDMLGNLGGNKLAAARYHTPTLTELTTVRLKEHHWLSSWSFDAAGEILIQEE